MPRVNTGARADKKWMARSCPVCGGRQSAPRFEKGRLHVVRCLECGMWFASPVEAELVTGAFYDRLAAPLYLSPDKLASDYATVRFERERRLFRRFCPAGDVLDVGCSTGAFLHQLMTQHPGVYSVLGTDVVEAALTHAASRGVPVARGPFLEDDFGGRQFDAITFWAVIEHLHEPRRFLARAVRLLKPGGHVFVLVPNAQSLAARWLGSRYRYFMPDHLNYFTARTLKALAASVGLEPVALRFTHFNPVVLWQDWRAPAERVPDAQRIALLKRTMAWKQNPALRPLRWLYRGLEWSLGCVGLADNLAMVLRVRRAGHEPVRATSP